MTDLTMLRVAASQLDACLQPIANRPIDFTNVKYLAKRDRMSPLDEAGIKDEAETVLLAAITFYSATDETSRDALRQLFAHNKALAWASGWTSIRQISPSNASEFRNQLLLFSLIDQGQDSRDAILEIAYLIDRAKANGIDTTPILTEIAALSSDHNKYGMGSTRQMMLVGSD